MKMKVYNKKKFWSGVVFLLLAAISIPNTIARFNSLDTLRIIKYAIVDTFAILFGVTEVYRSLSSKCTKEDRQNDDEREKLITMKSKSSAYNITFFICAIITILSAIVVGVTKNNVWGGIFIGIGIVPTIMIITEISSYFYYDKRN
ncbi:membrane protein [Clostridium lundense]|uniref:membrane protein n=1 Tax=Clostridium lundense TaxID=319475 RepID=UPI00048852F4|nr:membrane protein [Clostridium lundense]